MTALLRYQWAILLRSHRWIIPALLYFVLIAVQGSTTLASGLTWAAAILVPVVAILTRSMLIAEPDAARDVVAAARGPMRAQLAALLVALSAGVVLAVIGAGFELAVSTRDSGRALMAGVLVAAVCLLVGSAAGALCNPPLLRNRGLAVMATIAAVIFALAAGISPANAALRSSGVSGASWPGPVSLVGSLALFAVCWGASVLAAARRGLPPARARHISDLSVYVGLPVGHR
jgi:hypothetical protein